MSRFYDIDSRRITHREYFWWTKSPAVLLAWITKWLRIKNPVSSDDPNVESTLPFVVESLPADAAARFQPLTEQLSALGFHSPAFHVIADAGTQTTVIWATFQHESGLHFARIHNRLWAKIANPNRALFPLFGTAFADGTFLVSSSGKPDMLEPATVQMDRMPDASLTDLWAAHQRLVESASQRKNVARISTREELIEATERHHVLTRDFHVARGVFQLRSESDQQKVDTLGGMEHGGVLLELEKLQEKKPGWGGAIWVLLISMLVFFVTGAAYWDWKFMIILVPVVLFHETGHWIAMRLCHYRNLRMFFIPFFGAGVMGQNWNVPGWKKAIVALAGPLPGIVLGLFFGIMGMTSHKLLLSEIAIVLLFLNGLNLLPILPLDGGRVLHATLFCRNRWLDIVFRMAAVAGLFVLSALAGMKLLLPVAILLGVALPIAFKLGEVIDRLRLMPLPPPLPGQDNIPTPTAQAIISAVKGALPGKTSDKVVAMHTLNVFETLNAKPPGVLATLSLLALHGGAVFVTLIFSMVLMVSRHTGLQEFVEAAARQPQHAVACGEIRSWRGAGVPSTHSNPQNLIVVTCAHASESRRNFAQLTNQLPSTAGLTLFGESLLLTLPVADDAAREHWFDKLQSLATNVFVAVSNEPVAMSMTFLAPTAKAGTNLEQELKDYFQVSDVYHLIAPWSPEASGASFEVRRRRRHEWMQIGREVNGVWRDPAITNYFAKINAAHRRGAASEVDRLTREQQEQIRALQGEALERLRRPGSNSVSPALVDLYAKLMALPYTNRTDRAILNKQIGEILGATSNSEAGVADYGVTSGYVRRHGLLLEIRWVAFRDATAGLPAFVEWLCARGCIRIQYDFNGSFPIDSLED